MYTRKLIDFLFPEKQQTEKPEKAGTAPEPEPEFEWPPSAEDLSKFSVIPLHADDAPGRTSAPR